MDVSTEEREMSKRSKSSATVWAIAAGLSLMFGVAIGSAGAGAAAMVVCAVFAMNAAARK